MAKLYLTFEKAVLKEFPLTHGVITIGRLPDNLVQVDNLAVSGHHAKIYWDVDHFTLEDTASLNGTFVNDQRVSKTVLKDGDEVVIGKHTIVFRDVEDDDAPAPEEAGVQKAGPMIPTLDSTVVLDTRKAKEMLAQRPSAAASANTAAAVAPAQERAAMLAVIAGKTDHAQYVLTGKLTVIGKSDMASVRLKGWFAPKVAAMINHRDAKYSVSASEKKVKIKVNEELITGPRQLADGDTIEVGGVKLKFSWKQ